MSDAVLILPPGLRRLLPAARWQPVTVGRSGAQVWQSQRYVVKVAALPSPGQPRALQAEERRLRWLAGRVPVPQVIGYELAAGSEYLAVTRLPGRPMSDPEMLVHPARLTSLLARALSELHALPARDCPFTMTLAVTLRRAREQLRADPAAQTTDGQPAEAVLRELLRTRPATEDIVVTHGDPCLPNLIVNGEYVEGFVDVGAAGLADRHADLALACWSLDYNLGGHWRDLFLDTYGRARVDQSKLAYYAALGRLP